jgi:hypothetical protein
MCKTLYANREKTGETERERRCSGVAKGSETQREDEFTLIFCLMAKKVFSVCFALS